MVAEEDLNFTPPSTMMVGDLCEMLFEVLFGFLDCFVVQMIYATRTATKDTLCLRLDYFVHSTATEADDFTHCVLLSKELL